MGSNEGQNSQCIAHSLRSSYLQRQEGKREQRVRRRSASRAKLAKARCRPGGSLVLWACELHLTEVKQCELEGRFLRHSCARSMSTDNARWVPIKAARQSSRLALLAHSFPRVRTCQQGYSTSTHSLKPSSRWTTLVCLSLFPALVVRLAVRTELSAAQTQEPASTERLDLSINRKRPRCRFFPSCQFKVNFVSGEQGGQTMVGTHEGCSRWGGGTLNPRPSLDPPRAHDDQESIIVRALLGEAKAFAY